MTVCKRGWLEAGKRKEKENLGTWKLACLLVVLSKLDGVLGYVSVKELGMAFCQVFNVGELALG